MMNDRIRLIRDLRKQFKDGATPSRLIHHILDETSGTITYSEICGILQEAFCLPVVRISRSSVSPQKDHRGVILNRTLLADLVQARSKWDSPHPDAVANELSWMDGVAVNSTESIACDVRKKPFPGLSNKSWSALSSEEQEALYVQLTTGIVFSQRVEILARLVERLQGKIVELESDRSSAK
jgi:hypothetical protein